MDIATHSAQTVLHFLGQYLPVIGVSWVGFFALLYVWIKNGGEKWMEKKIETKFSKELESHKNILSKDLEDHKAKISAKMVLTAKQQEKEFEVAKDLWALIKKAEGSVSSVLAPYQQYTDILKFRDKFLEKQLDRDEFSDEEKESILSVTGRDRQKLYQEKVQWHKLSKADQANTELNNFNLVNLPFINTIVYEKVIEICVRYREAVIDFQTGLESEDFKMCRGAYKKAFPEKDTTITDIGKLIQLFLHP